MFPKINTNFVGKYLRSYTARLVYHVSLISTGSIWSFLRTFVLQFDPFRRCANATRNVIKQMGELRGIVSGGDLEICLFNTHEADQQEIEM